MNFIIMNVRDHEVASLYGNFTLSSVNILFRNAQIDILCTEFIYLDLLNH